MPRLLSGRKVVFPTNGAGKKMDIPMKRMKWEFCHIPYIKIKWIEDLNIKAKL